MRKYSLIFILLLALLLTSCAALGGGAGNAMPEATPVVTPAPTPVPLDGPMTLQMPDALNDSDAKTWVTGRVELRSEERKIGSLYLEWSHVPESWSFTADGVSVTVEKDSFLHQYVTLPVPASEIIMDIDSALCDVYAFEQGSNIPDWVQIWQPTLEHCDLLLFPTHADDEHVFFGGMMPYYAAERGYKVQVVYLTNHWAQVQRPHELLDGLWHAGIRNYPVIGPFADRWTDTVAEAEETMSRYDAAAFLTQQLRRFRPSVVIGHDLAGEYSHAQHIINARALTDAVVAAADGSIFPESAQTYGTWDTPKLYLHLYETNSIVMNWDVALQSYGGKTAMDVARESFALHESQQGFFYVYGEGDDWDSRKFGLYRTTVGPDTVGGDVFENITTFY